MNYRLAFYSILASALFFPSATFAQNQPDIKGVLGKTSQQAFGETRAASPYEIVGNLIDIALGFLGVIMLVLFLYAGYLWLTAAGNDDQVSKAKTILRNAVLGSLIILSAYTLSYFVLEQLTNAITG